MAVAQVSLGGRAGDHDRPGRRHEGDVLVIDVDPVDDARAGAQKAGPGEQGDRRAAMLGAARLDLAPLLRGVDVADDAPLVGVGGDPLEPARGDRADAVGRHPDVDLGPFGRPMAQPVEPRQEGFDVGVAEPPLRPLGLEVGAVPAGPGVCNRDQHDPKPLRERGFGDGDGHLVRVVVRRPVGLVVDVVELADGAVAPADHLLEGRRGRLVHRARVERLRQPVHGLAPAPEVVPGRGSCRPLPDPAQAALKRVRVGVRHRRDHVPAGWLRHRSGLRCLRARRSARPARKTASTGLWPSR